MTRLGARLPQERTSSFILDVRVDSNRLVLDDVTSRGNGTPCTWRCQDGGQGRVGLPSGDAGTGMCRVRWLGGGFSGRGLLRRGQLNRCLHRAACVPRRSTFSRLFVTLMLPLAALVVRDSRYVRSRAGLRLSGRLCRARRAFGCECCACVCCQTAESFFGNISGPLWS